MSLRTDVFLIDCEFHDREMNCRRLDSCWRNSPLNRCCDVNSSEGFRPCRHHRPRRRHRAANDSDDDEYLNSNLDEEVHHSNRFSTRMKREESSKEGLRVEQAVLFHLNVRLNPI